MKTLIFLLAATLMLFGCIGSAPDGMSWDEYYGALHRLKQTHEKTAIEGCRSLGSVSGRSYDYVGEAKEIAAAKAIRKGADTVYYGEVDVSPNWNTYVMSPRENVYDVYGTAYKCN